MTVCRVFCKESPCADNAAFSKTQRHTELRRFLEVTHLRLSEVTYSHENREA